MLVFRDDCKKKCLEVENIVGESPEASPVYKVLQGVMFAQIL